MSANVLLSTIILVAFIVTVVLAIGSYAAYKMRERRRPTPVPGTSDEPVFFERFYPRGAAASSSESPPETEEDRHS